MGEQAYPPTFEPEPEPEPGFLLIAKKWRFSHSGGMPVYIPDEKGELTALEGVVDSATQMMPPGELGASVAKMFLSLLALVILLFASYWFIRRLVQQRLQKGVGDASIQILEKRMISPKTMLYLVEVDNKKILLAESQLEIKRLETFTEPAQ